MKSGRCGVGVKGARQWRQRCWRRPSHVWRHADRSAVQKAPQVVARQALQRKGGKKGGCRGRFTGRAGASALWLRLGEEAPDASRRAGMCWGLSGRRPPPPVAVRPDGCPSRAPRGAARRRPPGVPADAGIERSQKILQGEQCSGKQLVAVGASGAEGRQHGFDLGVGASGVPGAVGLPGPEAL